MIDNEYYDLPYMQHESFPKCEYSKAGAMRAPIMAAVNSARLLPGNKMGEVVAVLEAALAHIGQEVQHAESTEVEPTDSSDPLDILLGPAEAEPHAGIGRE